MYPLRDETTLAITGCGFAAGNPNGHLEAYGELVRRGLAPVRLVAVCDVDRQKAEEFANRAEAFQPGYRPSVYEDYPLMLGRMKPDAVLVATKVDLHHRVAIDCLEAGAAVLTEKPMGITVRACRGMLEAAQKANRVLAVGHNYRRVLCNRAWRFALEEELIGRPVVLTEFNVGQRAVRFKFEGPEEGSTVKDPGTLLDRGVHLADLHRYLLGEEPRRVLEIDCPRRQALGNGFIIKVDWASGLVERWMEADAVDPAVEGGRGHAFRSILGTQGAIACDHAALDDGGRLNLEEYLIGHMDEDAKQKLFLGDVDWGGRRWVNAVQLCDFIDAVRNGRSPEVDGVQGMKAVAFVYAIAECLAAGKPIEVSDVENGTVDTWQAGLNQQLGI